MPACQKSASCCWTQERTGRAREAREERWSVCPRCPRKSFSAPCPITWQRCVSSSRAPFFLAPTFFLCACYICRLPDPLLSNPFPANLQSYGFIFILLLLFKVYSFLSCVYFFVAHMLIPIKRKFDIYVVWTCVEGT